jgi:D-alanyl-D-alanine dipeptidase
MNNILRIIAASCAGVDTAVLGCGDNDNGIWAILLTAVNILTAGVITLGVIGVTVSAIEYAKAGADSSKVATSKRRISEIVIGLVIWTMIAFFLEFLLPGGIDSLSPVQATGLVANPDSITMVVGDQTRLHATVQPAEANNNVTWTSADDSIVEVSKDGTAVAKRLGTTTATGTVGNGINVDVTITVTNATVTTTTASTPTVSGDGVVPIGPVYEDSTSIACAEGTIDLGVDNNAYHDGVKTSARICEIPNIDCTSSRSFSSNGHIVLNSRVSGAFYALGQRYIDTHGGSRLTATESYRSMERQTYFWNCYQDGKNGDPNPCNNGNEAARPGYSNHQLGLAVDLAGVGGWNSTLSQWLTDNLGDFGLARDVSSEYWHVNAARQYR